MGTITLENVRATSDITVKARLKDGGVAIDWSSLTDIKAWLFSDAQKAIAGRFEVSVDQEDGTVLVCTYSARKPQYPGVNRLIVQAKYLGRMKTYDKPCLNLVPRTADVSGTAVVLEDPIVEVSIEVTDVSSSIMDTVIAAAVQAAERAEAAAEAAEHMVDIHTGPAGKSPYIGENGHWFEWDETAHEYVDTETKAKGDTGETPDITIGTVTTVEPGTPAGATMTGTPEAPVLNLSIPKGAVGSTPNITVGTVTTGEPGTPVVVTITGTAEAPVLNIQIPQGMQGNTGSSVEYPFELVNNLTTDDATKALSAAQGKVLDGKVTELEAKVDDIATGKFYGYHPTVADLPEGDVPGYAYVGTESPYSIYNFDGTTWTDSGATVKRGEGQIIYLEDFPGYASDLSPVAMREFLQSAIDYVGEKKAMLVFPKGETFVVDIPEVDNDARYDCEGGDGLQIPSNIAIDFNYSTIKADTNHWWCYNVLHILQSSSNVILKNGFVVGDRDTHIMSNTISQDTNPAGTDEWAYGIMVHGPGHATLDNMVCSDLRGDGINLEGECAWNHTIPVQGASVLYGYAVDNSGALVVNSNSISTVLLTISTYFTTKAHMAGMKTYLTPRLTVERGSNKEHSYYMLISYYTDSDAFISSETILTGEPMNIPDNAIKFRITEMVADITETFSFWVMNTLWNEMSVITGCTIYRCGRNGIVPTICKKLTIENCIIEDIFGTNNQVAIDCEGTSYVQGDITIRGCLIKNPGYNGIVLAQGRHYIVDNCILVGCGMSSGCEDVHISNCQFDTRVEIFLSITPLFDSDIIYPKNTIENCIFNGELSIEFTDIHSSKVAGTLTRHYLHSADRRMLPYFYDCSISYVANYQFSFYRCNIISNSGLSFQTGVTEFHDCEITAPTFSSNVKGIVRCYNCRIRLTQDGNVAMGLQTDRFINNELVVETNVAASKVYFFPVGEICVFSGNKYTGNFMYRAFTVQTFNTQLTAAKIFIVERNALVSSLNNATTAFYLSKSVKDSTVILKANVFNSTGTSFTDIDIDTGIAGTDTLKVFTDNNVFLNGTLTELSNARIYRATWTPSVTP